MATRDESNPLLRDDLLRGEPLSLVGICLDSDTERLLKPLVEPVSLVRLRTHLVDYGSEDSDAIVVGMGNPPPDICLVDFDQDRRDAALAAERIHAHAPETAIFAISSQAQPDLIIQAMRSGCSEYLAKPLDRERFLEAVARVGGHKRVRLERYDGEVLVFLGAKGGCGVTTLVTQLGALLTSSCARKALVVDLHFDLGDAALYLGLTPYRYNFFELVENTDRLDGELLQSFLKHHASGLDLLPAPEGIARARPVPTEAMIQTFDFLRRHYEFILVDLPPGFSDHNLEMIRRADQVYIVTVAEVAALRNVARHLDYLGRKEILLERIRVVLNRHHKRGTISDAQIEKALQRPLFWKVPNQYAQVITAITGGDPQARLSSEVTRSLERWAAAIGSKPEAANREKGGMGVRGLWGR
jgi:pilus assembly protein CpaE